MKAQILKSFFSPDGKHRVLIIKRADGAYSYRRQSVIGSDTGGEWGEPGPDLGLYDSAETAEQEALAKMPRLPMS